MSSISLYHSQGGSDYQHPSAFVYDKPWSADLARLRGEKEFLEDQLANCVTRLHALRRKRTEIEHQLSTLPLPRRKRKKLQHENREIGKIIKDKERDEQACLNNLQACRTNIYIATGLPYSTFTSTTLPESNINATQRSNAKSDSTEMSWNGWSDDTSISPFEKLRQNPFFADEVAPETPLEATRRDSMTIEGFKQPPLWIPDADECVDLPVPPNSAQPVSFESVLSPTAVTFQPNLPLYQSPPVECELVRLERPLPVNINLADEKKYRRYTHVGISQRYNADRSCHGLLDGNSDRSRKLDLHGKERRRSRTHSL